MFAFIILDFLIESLYVNLLPVDDIQTLLQGADTLALEVVDRTAGLFRIPSHFPYLRRFCFEHTREGLMAVLHRDGITACCVGGDVDVEAYDAGCVDVLLIVGFA